jgi:hypothetical protein
LGERNGASKKYLSPFLSAVARGFGGQLDSGVLRFRVFVVINFEQVRHDAEVTAGNLTLSLENFLHIHFEIAEMLLRQAAFAWHRSSH